MFGQNGVHLGFEWDGTNGMQPLATTGLIPPRVHAYDAARDDDGNLWVISENPNGAAGGGFGGDGKIVVWKNGEVFDVFGGEAARCQAIAIQDGQPVIAVTEYSSMTGVNVLTVGRLNSTGNDFVKTEAVQNYPIGSFNLVEQVGWDLSSDAAIIAGSHQPSVGRSNATVLERDARIWGTTADNPASTGVIFETTVRELLMEQLPITIQSDLRLSEWQLLESKAVTVKESHSPLLGKDTVATSVLAGNGFDPDSLQSAGKNTMDGDGKTGHGSGSG